LLLSLLSSACTCALVLQAVTGGALLFLFRAFFFRADAADADAGVVANAGVRGGATVPPPKTRATVWDIDCRAWDINCSCLSALNCSSLSPRSHSSLSFCCMSFLASLSLSSLNLLKSLLSSLFLLSLSSMICIFIIATTSPVGLFVGVGLLQLV